MIEMWKRVGDKLGVKLNMWADYDPDEIIEREAEEAAKEQNGGTPNRFFVGKDQRRIFFLVERV
jgi:hypothetical protein